MRIETEKRERAINDLDLNLDLNLYLSFSLLFFFSPRFSIHPERRPPLNDFFDTL